MITFPTTLRSDNIKYISVNFQPYMIHRALFQLSALQILVVIPALYYTKFVMLYFSSIFRFFGYIYTIYLLINWSGAVLMFTAYQAKGWVCDRVCFQPCHLRWYRYVALHDLLGADMQRCHLYLSHSFP